LLAVVVVTACLTSYGINSWPMADDEVPSLVEMGLLPIDATTFSVPASQVGRLPRAVPVWYGLQGRLVRLLPQNQFGFRFSSVVFAVLATAAAFLASARWRGLWFATALAVAMDGSQLFVYLAQLDRFYSLAVLLFTLTLIVIWLPRTGIAAIVTTALLACLTVLSHNMTVVAFVLGFGAAVAGYVIGRVPARVLVRSGAAAAASTLVYLVYLRPIIQGWASTGNPTPPLVSFAAHAGMPLLALASLGLYLCVARRDEAGSLTWWALLFTASLAAMPFAPVSWNPRYFVFFMPAMWMLAALSMEYVARRLGRGATGAAWYGCVILLLLPGLLSHYLDGSRHDYRAAADVLQQAAAPGQPILSDDAETISYYLSAPLRKGLEVRTKVRHFPDSEFFLVARANVWTPLPRFPGRQADLLSEIYRRRFDHFSHVLRVYRVAPRGGHPLPAQDAR
jgi:hypothetical protein